MLTDDRLLYDALACAGALIGLAWLVVALARNAARRRPGLRIARPLATAAVTRLAAVTVVAAVPALRPLRGPDETGFIAAAHDFAADPGSLGALPRALVGNLHVAYMGVEQYLVGAHTDLVLRAGHIALALAAISILAIAVTDVAGPRAGAVSAWILAFEPTNVFFSGVLHKEAPMMLGEALVVLGAVRMYQRRDATAVAFMAAGLAIAALTRPYAAAALFVACAGVSMHAAVRRLGPARRRSPRLAGGLAVTLLLAVAAAPAPAAVLRTVQTSQNANSIDDANLALPPVDFTTLDSTAQNIDSRVAALLVQPFPWQAANLSQRAGVAGTAFAWMLMVAALVLALTRPRFTVVELAPLLYLVTMTVVVYALSTGNAGTGFRYRTHVLFLLAALVAALACTPRQSRRQAVRA